MMLFLIIHLIALKILSSRGLAPPDPHISHTLSPSFRRAAQPVNDVLFNYTLDRAETTLFKGPSPA
jgi:hypothetical protein